MPIPRRQFARVPDDVDVGLLQKTLVVVVGVGMVGSQIAEGLARFTVGRLRLIDHDIYETQNTLRHALPVEYVGWNKAIALKDWLPKQVEGLQVEAVARQINGSVSDVELDDWLAEADLVVAATDDREAQRRIGRRALLSEVPAIFPAIYPHLGGGEVVVQFDREWPCFGCWDYFRPDAEQLRGARALDLDAQPVIFHAEQFSLGILDPGSRQRDLLRGNPPHQLVMLDRAGVFRFISLTRRPTCPSCGGGPLRLAVPEPPVVLAPSPGSSVTSPLPAWPTPPPRPASRTRTADQSRSRNLKIVLSALVALIVFVLVLAESGGSSGVTPESPQEKAETQAAEHNAAHARIARLSFKCIEEPVCQTDFPGNPLPLFIDGLDQPLVSYVKHHGYQEQWSDNAGFLHAGWNTGGESSYVAQESEGEGDQNSSDAIPLGTGYIFEPLAEPAYGPGPEPNGVPKSGRWVITWQLKGPGGHALRTLRYSVRIVDDCGISAESYCARVSQQRSEGSDRGTTAGAQGGYSRAVYTPPPLFPYSE
jgi:hypothetical protein